MEPKEDVTFAERKTIVDEKQVQELIQLEASKMGAKLFINTSGAFKDNTGRLVRFGLGHVRKNQEFKSSDLIGFMPVEITPDMVGKKLPVFMAIECKKPDWKPTNSLREAGQKIFIDVVKNNNGIASFVNSVETFIETVKSYVPR